MIIVTVELLSAIDGRRERLAQMHICNEGGDMKRGDYGAYVMRGRDAEALHKSWTNRSFVHEGKVANYPRLALHVWNLVARSLVACGYK